MKRYLDHRLVLELYESLVRTKGYRGATLQRLCNLMAQRHYINRDTGRPYTRNAVHYIIKRTPEGRELSRQLRARGINVVILDPRFPIFSDRLATEYSGKLMTITEATVSSVQGSDLFGFAAVDSCRAARHIYVPTLDDIYLDHEPDLSEQQRIVMMELDIHPNYANYSMGRTLELEEL